MNYLQLTEACNILYILFVTMFPKTGWPLCPTKVEFFIQSKAQHTCKALSKTVCTVVI